MSINNQESHCIANRLEEVLLNGRWIANTNYKDQILNTTWDQATKKVGNLNTIAVLTYHINYYLSGVLNVFEGGNLEIRDKYSFDAPVITSAKDWQQRIDEFLIISEKFVNQVQQMSDDKLKEIFVDKKYGTYQRNIEAMIEHSYYHLGQIVIIKKMILDKIE